MTPSQEKACDLFMMSLCVWREARGEPFEGKLAVAYTIMNRAARPSWWGVSPYSVVTKPFQYSSITDPKDTQLSHFPLVGDPKFQECLDAATGALSGTLENPVPGADSYYAVYIPAPSWADPKKFVKQIGNHKFYNLAGDPAVVNKEQTHG